MQHPIIVRAVKGLWLGVLSWTVTALVVAAGMYKGSFPLWQVDPLRETPAYQGRLTSNDIPCIPAPHGHAYRAPGCEGEDGPPWPPSEP